MINQNDQQDDKKTHNHQHDRSEDQKTDTAKEDTTEVGNPQGNASGDINEAVKKIGQTDEVQAEIEKIKKAIAKTALQQEEDELEKKQNTTDPSALPSKEKQEDHSR